MLLLHHNLYFLFRGMKKREITQKNLKAYPYRKIKACAASSIRKYDSQMRYLQFHPYHSDSCICTTTIAFVFGEIAFIIWVGSILNVIGSISTKIGFAPLNTKELAVDTKVNEGIITSHLALCQLVVESSKAAVRMVKRAQTIEMLFKSFA